VIERACLMAEGRLVGELDVKASLPAPRPSPARSAWRAPLAAVPPAAMPTRHDEDVESLSDVEREHIVRALQHANGNKKKAASLLGVSRRALYRKLERGQGAA
jgi:two-component system nitrogen regulation response regulator GlnG/two-component system response regulator HydG